MRLLPIGITVFLINFPAGLFVYWITSNLVTLVQNYVIYHHGPGRRPPGWEPQSLFPKLGGTGNGGNGATPPENRRTSQDGSQGTQASANGDAPAQAAKTAKRRRRKKKKR
jgi:YidC/Oxa1 family membrane protein insertase